MILFVFAFNMQEAKATTYIFNSFLSAANWTTSSKWSPSYPGTTIDADDEVIIYGLCNINTFVRIEGTLTVNLLIKVNSGNTLEIENGGVINIEGTVNVEGRFTNGGTLNNNSILNLKSGGELRLKNDPAQWPGGTFNWNSGSTVRIHAGGSLNLSDVVNIPSNRTLKVYGDLTIESGGDLTIDNGGNLIVNNIGTNGGNLQINDGGDLTIDDGGDLTIDDDGDLAIHDGGDLTIKNGSELTIENGSELTIENGSELTIESGGTLAIRSGSGLAIESGGDLNNSGLLSNDKTLTNAGTLTITGTLEIKANGTFTNSGNLDLNSGGELVLYNNTATWPNGIFNWNNGTVQINNNAELTLTSSVTIPIGCTLLVDSGVTISMNVNNTILINYGVLENEGTITLDNGADLDNKDGGTFTVKDGGIVNIYGSSNLRNRSNGTLNVENGGTLNNAQSSFFGGDLRNYGSMSILGILNLIGGDLSNYGSMSILGTLNLDSGLLFLRSSTASLPLGVFNWTGGTLVVAGNGNLILDNSFTIPPYRVFLMDGAMTINSGVTLTNEGSITVYNSQTLTINGILSNIGNFTNNGTIAGIGTFNGSYNNINTIAPGSSPGCFHFENDFTNSGNIEIELADGSYCSEFDRITVGDNAIINGTINISFIDDIEPSNNTFTILTAIGILSGTPNIIWPTGYTGDFEIDNTVNPNELKVTLLSSLPVELIDFRVTALSDNSVGLDWQTASELNNLGFEIQRSNNSLDWETLGFVEGRGTSSEFTNYQFIDQFPNEGFNYYRLKQIDFDDGYEYSETKVVEFKNSNQDISVYPNPTSDELHIDLGKSFNTSNQNIIGQIQLFNSLGKLILVTEALGTETYQTLQLKDYPKGFYSLVITINQEVYTKQIIVQ